MSYPQRPPSAWNNNGRPAASVPSRPTSNEMVLRSISRSSQRLTMPPVGTRRVHSNLALPGSSISTGDLATSGSEWPASPSPRMLHAERIGSSVQHDKRSEQAPTSRAEQPQDYGSMARELGRLEMRLERSEEEAKIFAADSKRLRQERNDARTQLTEMRMQLDKAQKQVEQLEAALACQNATITSSQSNPRTPSRPHQPVSGVSPFSGIVGHQTPAPSRGLSPTKSRGAPRPMGRTSGSRSGPVSQHAPSSHGSIGEAITSFFSKVETWGKTWAPQPMSILSKADNVVRLRERVEALTQDRNNSDLIEDLKLRPYLVAAIINDHLTTVFGAHFTRTYDGEGHTELARLDRELMESEPMTNGDRHLLLQRRSSMISQMIRGDQYGRWLDGKTSSIAEHLVSLLSPMIPENMRRDASLDLKELVNECFQISARMMTTPREWIVEEGYRGQRWLPMTMIQRNPDHDYDLDQSSNGFAYIIRLGIAPSVIEKDYSARALTTQELHKKVVFLSRNLPRRPGRSNSVVPSFNPRY